ncbi:unnamed protein product [Mytilus edulis]|uniref:VWFA domain-containing protein n=1 Tax=Mytilus edulis TaxID=6550 RepID=A0A8S3R5K6_MYTED|nr:unnamed protein product [Mytilus edulis]
MFSSLTSDYSAEIRDQILNFNKSDIEVIGVAAGHDEAISNHYTEIRLDPSQLLFISDDSRSDPFDSLKVLSAKTSYDMLCIRNTDADIIILLDVQKNQSNIVFQYLRIAIEKFLKVLNNDGSNKRVGMIAYSDHADYIVKLSLLNNVDKLIGDANNVDLDKVWVMSNLSHTLQFVGVDAFSNSHGGRSSSRKIVVLFSSLNSDYSAEIRDQILNLNKSDLKVLGLATGHDEGILLSIIEGEGTYTRSKGISIGGPFNPDMEISLEELYYPSSNICVVKLFFIHKTLQKILLKTHLKSRISKSGINRTWIDGRDRRLLSAIISNVQLSNRYNIV